MKKILLFGLILMQSFCLVKAQLVESFDGITFPPAGWLNEHSAGANLSAVWTRATDGALLGDVPTQTSYTINPHSGAGMAAFNSYDYDDGNAANLISPSINLSMGGPHMVKFWMFRDNGYPNVDSISVYINTAAVKIGASFLGKIIRNISDSPVESGTLGWYQYSFLIPASFNSATNYLIFSAVSSFGNNMFIDDVSVEPQPSCFAPTSLNASSYNYAANTATANWASSISATAAGYEWLVNTTGINPTGAGTPVPSNTTNISGIVKDVINYVYVRTHCVGTDYSSWTSFSFAALPCATTTAPLNGAANVPQNQLFTWNSVGGATSYDFYLGGSLGSIIKIGNVTSATTGVSDLLPQQIYYWYIVPVINNTAAINSGCSPSSFTIAAEGNTPVNNTCGGAIWINANNTAGNPITSTTVDATLTLPANACEGQTGFADDDVWFQFTTAAGASSGLLTYTPLATGGISDIVSQVYLANSCGNLGSPVICSDTSGVANASETLDLSKLQPATHYYMRIYSFNNTVASRGGFTITASANNTLPVTLTNFSAKKVNNFNILNWITQQEVNTRYFIIELSNDGINYKTIGQVAATGSINAIVNYSFADNNPVKGNNYYRLRIVDNDSQFKLSDIRIIQNEGIAAVNIYPNPVKNTLGVNINVDKPAKGNMVVLDLSGKVLHSTSINIIQGNTLITIPVNSLAAGSYVIKIQLNDEVLIRKFNKQ